jgi:hypothetical protein
MPAATDAIVLDRTVITGTHTLAWEEAMAAFRDTTGRPGPATWELGTYPEGQADHPVGGVSWYEAGAYAAFAGKNLPTAFHWYNAAGLGNFSDILVASNYGSKGSAPVGQYQGLGPFGTYDMAGTSRNGARPHRAPAASSLEAAGTSPATCSPTSTHSRLSTGRRRTASG